jgi:hypothetical protein
MRTLWNGEITKKYYFHLLYVTFVFLVLLLLWRVSLEKQIYILAPHTSGLPLAILKIFLEKPCEKRLLGNT